MKYFLGTQNFSGTNGPVVRYFFHPWDSAIHLSYNRPVKLTIFLVVSDHSGVATGVKFGKNAGFIASTGMDRNLKFYA